MACRKCGSDWTTPTGKDCNRCPHCDKQQRFQARKQGRLPRETQKTCRACGRFFTATPQRHMALTCGSETCRKAGNAEKCRRHKARKRAGLATTMPPRRSVQPKKACKREGCENFVKARKHEYCSQTCAGADAREFKRPFMGLPGFARKAIAFASWFVDEWEPQRKRAATAKAEVPCLVCQKPTADASHKFCSRNCMKSWRGDSRCQKCEGVIANAHWCTTACKSCRKMNMLASRKANRSKFRSRARKFGVAYTPIKRLDVYERDGWRCQLCGKMCKRKWIVNKVSGLPHPRCPTIDHIVPMSRGGGHVMHNVHLSCWECNIRKGSRLEGQRLLPIA